EPIRLSNVRTRTLLGLIGIWNFLYFCSACNLIIQGTLRKKLGSLKSFFEAIFWHRGRPRHIAVGRPPWCLLSALVNLHPSVWQADQREGDPLRDDVDAVRLRGA